jgi:hypothetical protein
VKDEEVLRIAERREAADEIRGNDLEDHRVLDIKVGEAAGDDGERDDDEERHVVRHEARERAAEREQPERERSRGAEARDGTRDDEIEPTRRAKDLHRHQQREEDEEQIEIDRPPGRSG